MGRVIMSRVVSQLKTPVNPSFVDNSWEAIMMACQNNSVPEKWAVGDSKPMLINGTEYQVDIIGKKHDDYADGSGIAPLTFQLHDCYGATPYKMNNSASSSGGWNSSVIRKTELPAILALMPADIQNGIREVAKLASEGSQSAAMITSADKLFLLAEVEVFGAVTYALSGEGKQYDYYKAGNSKNKTLNGYAYTWWTRSPRKSNTSQFTTVSLDGACTASDANSPFGVSFAFCF